MLHAKQRGHQLTPGGFSLQTQPALSPVPLSGPVSLPCPSHTPLSFHPGLVPHSLHLLPLGLCTCHSHHVGASLLALLMGGGGALLVTALERLLIPPGSRAFPLHSQVSQHSALPLTLHHGVPLNVLYRTQRPVLPGPPSAARRPAQGRWRPPLSSALHPQQLEKRAQPTWARSICCTH